MAFAGGSTTGGFAGSTPGTTTGGFGGGGIVKGFAETSKRGSKEEVERVERQNRCHS